MQPALFMDWVYEHPEAASTLATGMAAVIGAVVIGLRQAAIQRRQADISKRQTDVADDSNKIALFERRMAIYEKLEELRAVTPHLTALNSDHTARLGEIEALLNKAEFLFDEDSKVSALISKATMAAYRVISRNTELEDKEGAEKRSKEFRDLGIERLKLMGEFLDAVADVREAMLAEMRLSRAETRKLKWPWSPKSPRLVKVLTEKEAAKVAKSLGDT